MCLGYSHLGLVRLAEDEFRSTLNICQEEPSKNTDKNRECEIAYRGNKPSGGRTSKQ